MATITALSTATVLGPAGGVVASSKLALAAGTIRIGLSVELIITRAPGRANGRIRVCLGCVAYDYTTAVAPGQVEVLEVLDLIPTEIGTLSVSTDAHIAIGSHLYAWVEAPADDAQYGAITIKSVEHSA
jgi:hypothetical protein